MKRILFSIVFLAACLVTQAQQISVASFRMAENDLTAMMNGTEVKDQNGNTCALIKVQTSQTGFTFDVGMMGVMKTEQHTGEIWVYVPFGVKRITIHHQQLGHLNDYYFPCSIEKGRTYIMQLTTGRVETVVTEVVQQQFLVFEVTPPDAMVTVNGQLWAVQEGVALKLVDFGRYEYRVEAPDYHSSAGIVTVSDPDNKVVEHVTLSPAFGWLKLEGDAAVLAKASVYIDNANGADALRTPRQLKSGQHKVKVVHPLYKPYEQAVVVSDNQTHTLNINLNPNFSNVTLKVDADAEIWVNGEKKGVRSWTGDLEAGNYLVECKMEKHRTTSVRKTITENMSGETIVLTAPTPITGRLVVSSTPAMAKLSIDGKEMGETPLLLNALIIGEHQLRLEKKGCAPLVKTITIEEGKTLSLDEKLDTGRNITVKTDRSGDKVHVDGDYVGTTPLTTSVGFGQHTVKVVRGNAKEEKTVDIRTSSADQELFFEFGRLIAISTDQDGDLVFIDGEKAGVSPLSVDVPFGKHVIHAERGKKYADKDIQVLKSGGDTRHHLVLHGETAARFVERGVNFATLNFAYSPAPQPSVGFAVGSVKKVGWFATVMSGFGFEAMDATAECDAQGMVNGEYPDYNGESCTTRLSAMGGLMVSLGGPVCLRVGAGYGMRVKSLRTYGGQLVKDADFSVAGPDATAGLQLNLKGFTLSLDAVTTNFKTVEAKIGIGYCWKKK